MNTNGPEVNCIRTNTAACGRTCDFQCAEAFIQAIFGRIDVEVEVVEEANGVQVWS